MTAEHFLVCLDHGEVTDAVVAHAARLAEAAGARVTLLHVAPEEPAWIGYEVGPQTVRDRVAGELRGVHRATQGRADALRERGLDAHALTVRGMVAEKVMEQARALGATVIAVGANRHGRLGEVLTGSVARQIVRLADRPVLVVPKAAG